MSYKIRRPKSQIQVSRVIESNQSWQHEKTVDILMSEIENLNLELRCKTYEMEYMKSSRDIEQEIYSLVIAVLLNSDDEHELSKKLVELDKLINNLINDFLHTFYTSSYSGDFSRYVEKLT